MNLSSKAGFLICASFLAPLVAQTEPGALADKPQPPAPSWSRQFNAIDRADWRPLTGRERWTIYWKTTYASPATLFRAAGPALGDHLDHRPDTWPQGAEGYARRFANRFARFSLQESMSHSASAALGYDVRYVRCGCQGFFPRFGHAMLWNFLTLNQNGRTVLNTPRIGSAFAAEFIANSWMPQGYRTNSEAVRGVGVQLGVGALFNTIREFAPRRKTR
jgi:hypothetical protein